MPEGRPLQLWGYGAIFTGGVLIVTATVAGFVLWNLFNVGVELLPTGAERVFDVMHRMSPILVLVWGLVAGAVVLGAALNLRPGLARRPWLWSTVAILGAGLSVPVTAGFGFGGLVTVVGAGLAMADAALVADA